MLKSPGFITVGASSIERTARFFQAFGFVRESGATLSGFAARELYGLTGATSEAILTKPGARLGYVRVVETREATVEGGPFDRGPHAIDLYVRDMETALEVVRNSHAEVGPVAAYRVGPMTIKECKCAGPDGMALVLIEVDKRRPSVLDLPGNLLFSEIHSAVSVVESIDAASAFWVSAGLKVLLDATFAEPAVAEFMHLPRPDTRLRLALFADQGQSPIRLEMIEFPDPDARNAPKIDPTPLRPGRFLFGFDVADVGAAMRALDQARYSKICRVSGGLAAVGIAPGGIGFELRHTAV